MSSSSTSIYPFENTTRHHDKITSEMIEDMTEDYTEIYRHYSFTLGPYKQYWIILRYQNPKESNESLKPICLSYRPYIRTIKGLSILNVTHFQAIPLIQKISVCLHSLILPTYILLWIIDWFPNMDKVDHEIKLKIIKDINDSCQNVYIQRNLQLKESD